MPEKHDHNGHRKRLRQKYLSNGFSGFTDQELIEMLLFTTIPRSNTSTAASNLLKEFDTIDNIIHSEPSELQKVAGIGASSADLLNTIGKIVDKLSEQKLMEVCCDPREVIKNYVKERFCRLPANTVSLILCDELLNIVNARDCPVDCILRGTVTLRGLLEDILFTDASHVIIAFNHKDHIAVPEDNDYLITNNIASSLQKLDILLEDVLVIGEKGNVFSFRESGSFSF